MARVMPSDNGRDGGAYSFDESSGSEGGRAFDSEEDGETERGPSNDDRTREEIAALIRRAQEGDHEAMTEVVGAVLVELRRRAHAIRNGFHPDPTLLTTELVDEFYLKVLAKRGSQIRDFDHLFARAARAMRHILIDHFKKARKRPVLTSRVFEVSGPSEASGQIDLFDLGAALDRLQPDFPELVNLIEMKFFLGLEMKEIAEALGISASSAYRLWRDARALLRSRLGLG